MRFLTREWHAGDLSGDEADALETAHAEHLAATLSEVSPQLLAFHTTVSIHAGMLQAAVLDHRDATLRILLRCGDLQDGYRDVALTYLGIDIAWLDVALLKLIVDDSHSEALSVEIERMEDYSYVHRWLWWPFYREVDIPFRALTVLIQSPPYRDFERPRHAFTEIRAKRYLKSTFKCNNVCRDS